MFKTSVDKFRGFYGTLDNHERHVLQKVMLSKNPMTQRELANKMGYRSKNSIRRIKKRIIRKAHNYFKEEK
jgi:hypothetical protein